MSKKLKWILTAAGVVVLAGGGVVFASRGKDKSKGPTSRPSGSARSRPRTSR